MACDALLLLITCLLVLRILPFNTDHVTDIAWIWRIELFFIAWTLSMFGVDLGFNRQQWKIILVLSLMTEAILLSPF